VDTNRAAPRSSVRHGVRLFRVGGIEINIDYSWLFIFLLVLWSLSVGYFPSVVPGQGVGVYWIAGLIATVGLFASILLHELSHSFAARRAGIEVPSITLFLFGGVSEMSDEPRRPPTEIWIAAVGPLTSFVLAGFFWVLYALWPAAEPGLFRSILGYLAFINAALGVFNLLPGFPLDGGRILRAVVWWRTGSLERATRAAANAGQGFAIGLMVLGALQIFGGNLIGGIWLILIGLFLRGMAQASYQAVVLRQALGDVEVGDVMIHDPVTVTPDTPIRSLIDDYFLTFGYRGFPVVEDGQVRGVVSIADVKDVPAERRDETRVAETMRRLEPALRIDPRAALSDALRQMAREGTGRLVVMRDGALVGMITKTGLSRFVELHEILGDVDSARAHAPAAATARDEQAHG
jgi:Zn-dependent protease/CBS domain-containing protein